MKFQYESLSGLEIRVLRVPAQPQDQAVHATIKHVNLEDSPSYKTLSYVWGNSKVTKPMFVKYDNDSQFHEIQVTTNLAAALQHMLPEPDDEPLVIWIDAICINQQDLKERNDQVHIMGLIYKRCYQVNIWFGNYNEPSNYALKNVDEGSRGELNNTKAIQEAIKWMSGHSSDKSKIVAGLQMDKMAHHGMICICNREWFERVWTLQEGLLPPRHQCFLGSSQFSWDDLLPACVAIHNSKRGSKDFFLLRKGFMHLSLNWKIRQEHYHKFRNKPSNEQLFDLLDLTTIFKATDMRDKLYGLFSLVDDVPFEPDYCISYDEMCYKLARYLIAKGSIKFLQMCPNDFESSPSWTPKLEKGATGSAAELEIWREAPTRQWASSCGKYLHILCVDRGRILIRCSMSEKTFETLENFKFWISEVYKRLAVVYGDHTNWECVLARQSFHSALLHLADIAAHQKEKDISRQDWEYICDQMELLGASDDLFVFGVLKALFLNWSMDISGAFCVFTDKGHCAFTLKQKAMDPEQDEYRVLLHPNMIYEVVVVRSIDGFRIFGTFYTSSLALSIDLETRKQCFEEFWDHWKWIKLE